MANNLFRNTDIDPLRRNVSIYFDDAQYAAEYGNIGME